MQGNFTVELVERLKAYYRRFDVELSDEQAREYLCAYADLYECFARMSEGEPAARVHAAAGSTGVRNTCGTLQLAP